ncbi:hypothetical protein LTR93_012225, partial [Exophiala xenobiotica]
MSQTPGRANVSQWQTAAVSNPIRTELKRKRGTQSPDEVHEEARQPNDPADPNHTTAKSKGKKRAWWSDKVQEE